MKTALITGGAGQDGSYLTEFLLNKKYKVLSIVKKHSDISNIKNILNKKLKIYEGDILDYLFINDIICNNKIDECYHLASQSSVGLSVKNPFITFDVNLKGTINLLESIKDSENKKYTKIFFPLSSEIFSHEQSEDLDQNSQYNPMSPYSISKLSSYYYIKYLRKNYNMFISCGILWNHESPRRSKEFVIPKIIQSIIDQKNAILKNKKIPILYLGNIYAKRDWGDARDFIQGFWKQLQLNYCCDLIFSAHQIKTIKQIVDIVYSSCKIEIPIRWKEDGINTKALFGDEVIVEIDKELYRDVDTNYKSGNIINTKNILNWEPTYTIEKTIDDIIELYLKE